MPIVGPPDIGAYEAGQFPWPNLAAELAETLPNTGPASGVSPGGDFDGDGNRNEDEVGFGTDMLNPNSFFRPETTLDGGLISFSFPTRSDRSYHFQWSETLGDDWTTEDAVNGDGIQRSFAAAYPIPGRPKRFYRLMVSE